MIKHPINVRRTPKKKIPSFRYQIEQLPKKAKTTKHITQGIAHRMNKNLRSQTSIFANIPKKL